MGSNIILNVIPLPKNCPLCFKIYVLKICLETKKLIQFQGRLFSYPDTHRHRLGTNYQQIPINCPMSPVNHYQRDGPMCVSKNHGNIPKKNTTPGLISDSVKLKYIFDI